MTGERLCQFGSDADSSALYDIEVGSYRGRYWDLFAALVCAAAAVNIAYWRRSLWDILIVASLSLAAGYLMARFLGLRRMDE
jgi:hypothetical protein